MHFTAETSSNGVIERNFILDEITGVLWSPTSDPAGSPLLLAGHSGGMHKKAPGLVASALHSVTTYGFTVAAIDAPGHGDRARNLQDQQWAEAIHQARSTGQPITSIVIDYNMSLAERAVPEWQATLDALQALPEIGVENADRLRRRDVGCRDRADVDGGRIPDRCGELRWRFRVRRTDRGGRKAHRPGRVPHSLG